MAQWRASVDQHRSVASPAVGQNSAERLRGYPTIPLPGAVLDPGVVLHLARVTVTFGVQDWDAEIVVWI